MIECRHEEDIDCCVRVCAHGGLRSGRQRPEPEFRLALQLDEGAASAFELRQVDGSVRRGRLRC